MLIFLTLHFYDNSIAQLFSITCSNDIVEFIRWRIEIFCSSLEAVLLFMVLVMFFFFLAVKWGSS